MKFLFFFLLFSINVINLQGQIFANDSGGEILDYQGYFYRDFFPLEVTGLPVRSDCEYGLEKVYITIKHEKLSDLKVSLMSPDGTTFWLTNRNGGEQGGLYYKTCFINNGFDGFIYNAKQPFFGEFIPDGRIEKLNNGQNPNGFWYLIIEDLKSGNLGDLQNFELYFSDHPMCEEKSACIEEQAEDCYCSQENEICELKPDLVILEEMTRNSLVEFAPTHEDYPRQIRFGAGMANIGDGPLEITGFGEWYCGDSLVTGEIDCPDKKKAQQRVRQNIYIKQDNKFIKNSHLAGTIYFDEKAGHNHYHAEGWVNFVLLKKRWWTSNPKCWKVIGQSEKISYCLVDSNVCSDDFENCKIEDQIYSRKTLPNYGLGNYQKCDAEKQGISVGGVDYYGTYYEGQFIQLPDNIKNGKYYLYLELDPLNQYKELNDENNTCLIPVILAKQ